MVNRLTVFIFLALSGSLAWAEPRTLVDCLNEALQKNPKILQAQQFIIQAGGQLISAKAALYPAINASSNLQTSNNDVFREQSPANPGFDSTWSVTLQLTKTFYNGGITRNQIAVAKLQQDISTIELQEAVNQAIYDTRNAFYNVLVNESDINRRKQTIDLLKREVERQKSLFEAGRATKFNIIRTEVRLANELPGLEQATVAYQTAVYNLLNTMGVPSPATGQPLDFAVSGTLEITPFSHDVDALVSEARSHSPELVQDEKQIEVQKRYVDIAKAALIPQLSVFAGTDLQRDNSQGAAFLDNHQTSVMGLAGTWNIFDGFSSKGNAIQSESQMRQATILRDAANRQIEYDVRTALLNLKQAENSYQIQQANVQKAMQSIDLARSSVEAGIATQFDILQATVDLSDAQNIELQSRFTYNVAVATLERLLYRRIKGTTGQVSDLSPAPSPVDPQPAPAAPPAATPTPAP
jgi:outer membrane protein